MRETRRTDRWTAGRQTRRHQATAAPASAAAIRPNTAGGGELPADAPAVPAPTPAGAPVWASPGPAAVTRGRSLETAAPALGVAPALGMATTLGAAPASGRLGAVLPPPADGPAWRAAGSPARARPAPAARGGGPPGGPRPPRGG